MVEQKSEAVSFYVIVLLGSVVGVWTLNFAEGWARVSVAGSWDLLSGNVSVLRKQLRQAISSFLPT
jgi:hypothetical protein